TPELLELCFTLFFFSSRRRHTRWPRDWSSDVCSSDLAEIVQQQERIEVAGISETEGAAEVDACSFQRRLGFDHTFYGSDGHKGRSEERRVGKECRVGWLADDEKERKKERM